jgi:hypothetical protein
MKLRKILITGAGTVELTLGIVLQKLGFEVSRGYLFISVGLQGKRILISIASQNEISMKFFWYIRIIFLIINASFLLNSASNYPKLLNFFKASQKSGSRTGNMNFPQRFDIC